MARGKKYNDDIKEKAFAMLAANNNITEVSKQLNIPWSTLKSWIENDDKLFAELREKNRKKFVNNAWRIICKGQVLIEREVDKALIDKTKSVDMKELAIVIGTMYDKQALSNKEATQIVDGGLELKKKFEDL